MFISRGILRFSRKTAFLPPARLCSCPYKKRADICPQRAAATLLFSLRHSYMTRSSRCFHTKNI